MGWISKLLKIEKKEYDENDTSLLKKQAEGKDVDAIFDLALKYYHGEGVEQSYDKAIELYESIADKDFMAAHNLALIYCGVFGENKNFFNKGMPLFIKNAEEGYGPSCCEIMKLMLIGFNVEQNHQGALHYLQKCLDIEYFKGIGEYYRTIAAVPNIGLNINDAIQILEPDSSRAVSIERQIITDRTPSSANWRIKKQSLLENDNRQIDEIEVEFDNGMPSVIYYFDVTNALNN